MKRLLIVIVAVMGVTLTASAWGRLGHATVAQIAENHLTPKAKRLLTKYLDGKSIVFYASYADDYKPEIQFDLGFKATNHATPSAYPHSFAANDDCTPFRGIRNGDKYVKNCIHFLEQFAADLKANHRTMDEKKRLETIAYIVHWVGDMHCPEHIRYPEDQTLGKYNVYFGKRKIVYHALWDEPIVEARNPWGYSDYAKFLDICTKKEIAEIQKGGAYDWGYEAAKVSRRVHAVKPDTKLDPRLYLNEYMPLAEDQILRAGYRLAKMLNEIFK